MPVQPRLDADPISASAGDAAAAALRELPEALILVFDQELRFVLAAGQVLERNGRSLRPTGRGSSSATPFRWTSGG